MTVANNDDSGMGSLRNAISCAGAGDTITFAQGLDGVSITLLSMLVISSDVVLSVPQGMTITIDGEDIISPFRVLAGVEVAFEGLSIIAGTAIQGSGIINAGDLTLRDVIVQPGNQSGNDLIYNVGNLSMEGNCQVLD